MNPCNSDCTIIPMDRGDLLCLTHDEIIYAEEEDENQTVV